MIKNTLVFQGYVSASTRKKSIHRLIVLGCCNVRTSSDVGKSFIINVWRGILRRDHAFVIDGWDWACYGAVVNEIGMGRLAQEHKTMGKFYFQGDVCLERVDDVPVTGAMIEPDPDGAVVLARGETTGHRHAFYGGAMLFRDDALARDMPAPELYIGHVKLEMPTELVHGTTKEAADGDHAAVQLPAGTYRVRGQRRHVPDVDPMRSSSSMALD